MDGEESSINFRRKILQRIKDLTNSGKHLEAQQLYQKYFGGSNGKSRSS
jgi:ABC-type amino acid transport substrate-binding protein